MKKAKARAANTFGGHGGRPACYRACCARRPGGGAIAIGAIAIGVLRVKKARIDRFSIGSLEMERIKSVRG